MSHLEPPPEDPLLAFTGWYDEAVRVRAPFADAMTLATASRDARPSARIVLYKGLSEGKVRFVTNYASRKGLELEENPHAALVFFWPALERQVRFEGRIQRAAESVSDEYFKARDRESQLGAWASEQSQSIASRAELEERLRLTTQRFSGKDVPRPPGWGMYLLEPDVIELWQSQPHRLHDRLRYDRSGASWATTRLLP